jgi:signal transduction histidine kinase
LKIRLDEIDEVRINGNADRLKQLLLNLVSNAIRFYTRRRHDHPLAG